MPRRPDLPCAECGKLMRRSGTSLPEGKATCHPCRRSRNPRPSPNPKPCCCALCFRPKPGPRFTYCRPCGIEVRRSRGDKRERVPPSTERGYGGAHKTTRKRYIAAHKPGDPCARCGDPMWDDVRLLDLDHNDERTGYLGLSHRACNRRTAGSRPRPRYQKVCDHCGLWYVTTHAAQATCSLPCRRAERDARRESRLAAKTKRPTLLSVCVICGDSTTRKHACSRACDAEYWRRSLRDRYRAAHGIPVNPEEPSSKWLKTA